MTLNDMMILVYAIKFYCHRGFSLNGKGVDQLVLFQNGRIGKLLESGGVEAWKVEMLRFGRWRN